MPPPPPPPKGFNLVKSKPKRRLSINSLQSPAPLPYPGEKNIDKAPPFSPSSNVHPPPPLVKSKPKRGLSSDTLQSPAPLPHPGEKSIVKPPTFSLSSNAPPLPPPICIPSVMSKPKLRLSIDSLQFAAPLPHPDEKNIVEDPAFSPSANAACLLTFCSDSEYNFYNDVPGHLPMGPNYQYADSMLGRSNTMTSTKKLMAFSKWNCRWKFWKKNGKGGEPEINKNPTSLPLYQPGIPSPRICFPFIKSKPKRHLYFDSLPSPVSSKWGYGWGVGKKNVEECGESPPPSPSRSLIYSPFIKSKPKRRLSFDSFQSTASSKWGYGWGVGKKNEEEGGVSPPPSPPPLIYPPFIMSKPKRHLSFDSLKYTSYSKRGYGWGVSPPPSPPPLICPPFVKSKPKRRRSFDSLKSTLSSKWDYGWGVGKKNEEEGGDSPPPLPPPLIYPTIIMSKPKRRRSFDSLKSTSSSKWDYGWGVGKKNEQESPLPPSPLIYPTTIMSKPKRRLSYDSLKSTSSSKWDYGWEVGKKNEQEGRWSPPPLPPPLAPLYPTIIMSKPKRRLSYDSLKSTSSSKLYCGWRVGKKNEEMEGELEISEKSASPVDLPLYQPIVRWDLKSTQASRSTQKSQDSHHAQNTHRTHKSQRTHVTQQSKFEVLKYHDDYSRYNRRHAPPPATTVTTSRSVSENEVAEELPDAELSLSVSERS